MSMPIQRQNEAYGIFDDGPRFARDRSSTDLPSGLAGLVNSMGPRIQAGLLNTRTASCDYCGEEGHDWEIHPEAHRDVADWQREKHLLEFPFGDHREARIAVNVDHMDPDSHAYHQESYGGAYDAGGHWVGDEDGHYTPRREWNPDFGYEMTDEDERNHELVAEDDDSGYNWGPEPTGIPEHLVHGSRRGSGRHPFDRAAGRRLLGFQWSQQQYDPSVHSDYERKLFDDVELHKAPLENGHELHAWRYTGHPDDKQGWQWAISDPSRASEYGKFPGEGHADWSNYNGSPPQISTWLAAGGYGAAADANLARRHQGIDFEVPQAGHINTLEEAQQQAQEHYQRLFPIGTSTGGHDSGLDYSDLNSYMRHLESMRRLAKDGGCTCWEGYERVPGTEPCASGSCRKKTSAADIDWSRVRPGPMVDVPLRRQDPEDYFGWVEDDSDTCPTCNRSVRYVSGPHCRHTASLPDESESTMYHVSRPSRKPWKKSPIWLWKDLDAAHEHASSAPGLKVYRVNTDGVDLQPDDEYEDDVAYYSENGIPKHQFEEMDDLDRHFWGSHLMHHTAAAEAPMDPAQMQVPMGGGYQIGHRVGLPWRNQVIPGTVIGLDGSGVVTRWDDGQYSTEEPHNIQLL